MVWPCSDHASALEEQHSPIGHESGKCVACWMVDASIIFQPCGHVALCSVCAQPFLSCKAVCPLCHNQISQGIAVED